MKDKVKGWILTQQNICDQIIANACKEFWNANKHKENFHYDLKKCHSESYELVRGRDLCYDRLNTALTYSLWYHPRRINTFLSFFIDKLIELSGQKIELFDLGAGTGAVQWAVLLTAYGLKKVGIEPPKIRIINIDTSPFMLYFNRDYLWQHFLKQYQFSSEEVQIEYSVNSWNNENNLESSNTFIASSYLFDSSDNREKIKEDFLEIVNQYSPSTLLLLTSQNKRQYLNTLLPDFKELGYQEERRANNGLLFNQPLNSVNGLRNELKNEYTDIAPLSNRSTWQDPSHFGVILSKSQGEISLSTDSRINGIDLFNPPITVRKEVSLNQQQRKASRYSNTPSVIVGPAGCGKSIVISEKVLNTVRHHNYDQNLKILITTFNKSLIGQLSKWLSETLDSSKFRIVGGVNFFFNGSNVANIRLLHFDILPLRIGGVPFYGLVNEQTHIDIIEEIIKEVKAENGITNNQYDTVLNVDFLLEEYHRVIYGLEVGISRAEENYYQITRQGRGRNPSLPRNSQRRKLVFSALKKYAYKIYSQNIPSFTVRRQVFKSNLISKKVDVKFDYLFVDEFQDCTQADFRIFNLLLKNPDNLTVAGDLAQAVHIGKSAKIPRFQDMARRQFHRLEGSYRLPVRVSEAIKPISEAIKIGFNNEDGVGIITPYKGSPPGARPIVVYAPTLELIATKISEIFRTYSIYEIKQVTILEKDSLLSQALNQLGVRAETDTILRLKGLEKRCIIWSTRANIEYEKEVFEFVYTILSRTSAILIIALSDNSLPVFKPVIGKFNSNRLILWDTETENKFATFCESIEIQPNIDE